MKSDAYGGASVILREEERRDQSRVLVKEETQGASIYLGRGCGRSCRREASRRVCDSLTLNATSCLVSEVGSALESLL